jgi:CubicO group peptidase (beta-lactamase class C family)
MYREAKVHFGTMTSLKDMIDKLSKLPLMYHPGDQWVYSVAHDVQAYLVEHFSGKPFDQYVREAVINPLKLTDLVFGAPKSHRDRYAATYGQKTGGGLEVRENADGTAVKRPETLGVDYARYETIPFGGLGLSGTALSYARFAQMLLNKGELDGVRILSRKTVELMTMNHLPPSIPSIGTAGDNGIGYGLGVSVVLDPAREGVIDSAGQFGWGGAASTKVFIDPKESMVVIVMTQYMPFDPNFLSLAQTLAYQAIVD